MPTLGESKTEWHVNVATKDDKSLYFVCTRRPYIESDGSLIIFTKNNEEVVIPRLNLSYYSVKD
jgi:hypothetical protein